MHVQIPLSSRDLDEISAAVAFTGARLTSVHAIAPDASTRRFYRLRLTGCPSLVACVYPVGEEARLDHDWTVHRWAWRRKLPIPEPLSRTARVALSTDLGERGLDAVLRSDGEIVLPAVLKCMEAFQQCPPDQNPNSPFDAALFRRELDGFAHLLDIPATAAASVGSFFNHLVGRLVQHPYRITHRDFHANNLLLYDNMVWAVDFQDVRLGPDTYDLVSLLRERAGAEVIGDEARWCADGAKLLRWKPGWGERYLECACQRGLKVLGTFMRLAQTGQRSYLAYVPAAARKALQALHELGAPGALTDAVARFADQTAYNRSGEEP